jgi:Flp pilus assembly pilin Flp
MTRVEYALMAALVSLAVLWATLPSQHAVELAVMRLTSALVAPGVEPCTDPYCIEPAAGPEAAAE